jgi:mRNA-degrading endonuclease RelE of RelBE toxin-antitoxin system
MSFEIVIARPFERKFKRLAKKYKSLPEDFNALLIELASNPKTGDEIIKDCFKIRLAISSKGKGKSAGARVITFVQIRENTIYLLDIYDKSEQENISNKELKSIIESLI